LLADHAVSREGDLDQPPHHFLGGAIGDRHRRAVAFLLHADLLAKIAADDLAGCVGESLGKREMRGSDNRRHAAQSSGRAKAWRVYFPAYLACPSVGEELGLAPCWAPGVRGAALLFCDGPFVVGALLFGLAGPGVAACGEAPPCGVAARACPPC